MGANLIGALAGGVIGVASLAFARALAGRVELADTKRALHVSGMIQLVFFPIAGWFIAPLVLGD